MNKVKIGSSGIAAGVHFVESPNHDARPDNSPISLVVIHNISLPPGQYGGNAVLELFTNILDADAHPYYSEIYQLKVSSHFFIRRDGDLIQFVSCNQRAWHAGESSWQGRNRCNDFSIGIELEGSDDDPFEPAQYITLELILTALRETYPITDIVGHSDIAPGRKTDPGPFFDWSLVSRPG